MMRGPMAEDGGDAPAGGDGTLGWSCPSDREFEVAKASFDQNFQQFRHLNDQMNRLPAFAVTLTGGFWYVAVVVANYGRALGPVEESLARWGLMIFAGLCDLTLACIAIRVRDVMADYLDRVRRFEGIWWTDRTPSLPIFRDYSMISMYVVLILAGTVLSWAGAFALFWPAELSLWWGILLVVGALLVTGTAAYWIPKWLTR